MFLSQSNTLPKLAAYLPNSIIFKNNSVYICFLRIKATRSDHLQASGKEKAVLQQMCKRPEIIPLILA